MKLAAACALVSVTACAVGPDYHRPTVPTVAAFRGQREAETRSFADLPWWQAYRDPELLALLREALTNSYDVAAAVARVQQAVALANVAADALWPRLALTTAPAYQRIVSPLALPNGGGQANASYAVFPVFASAAWEIDLWGRLRRTREAALAQALATEDVRRGVIVSLVGDVARGYFQLAALDRQLAITRRTVESFRETLALFRTREEGGVGDRLQTASEEGRMEQAAANLASLEQQIAARENALSVLVGRPPGPIARGARALDGAPPAVPPLGLPVALLARRPDVHESEQALVAANAQVGAAKAGYFPMLSASGSVGLGSRSLTALFNTNALTWAVSGTLAWLAPILGGAQVRHQVAAQESAFAAQLATYRLAVLAALSDVATATAAIEALAAERVHLEAAVRAFGESVEVAKVRFRNGVASYLDVVQAEQALYPAELQLTDVIGAQFVAMTQLYRALGGGWQVAASGA